MKIFLSWSGEDSQSHQVAKALHKCLPRVIQHLKPFLSSHDVDSGTNWGPEVDKQLLENNFGILAITKASMLAPWLLFEAGALSKHVNRAHVCPYLLGLKPTDLEGPLSKLQSRESNKSGTMMLLETINKALPNERILNESALKEQFEMWWPKFKEDLENIKNDGPSKLNTANENVREDRDLLEEILTLSRAASTRNAGSSFGTARITKSWLKQIEENSSSVKEELNSCISALSSVDGADKAFLEKEISELQEILEIDQKFKNALYTMPSYLDT